MGRPIPSGGGGRLYRSKSAAADQSLRWSVARLTMKTYDGWT